VERRFASLAIQPQPPPPPFPTQLPPPPPPPPLPPPQPTFSLALLPNTPPALPPRRTLIAELARAPSSSAPLSLPPPALPQSPHVPALQTPPALPTRQAVTPAPPLESLNSPLPRALVHEATLLTGSVGSPPEPKSLVGTGTVFFQMHEMISPDGCEWTRALPIASDASPPATASRGQPESNDMAAWLAVLSTANLVLAGE